MVKRYPDRFIGAFSVDPFDDQAMAIVHRYVEDLGFRAIKFEISQGGGCTAFTGRFAWILTTGCPGFFITWRTIPAL